MVVMADVHERFAQAFASIGAIAKGQKNTHHGYSYRGIDDVLNALHQVLADHGLFYVPRKVDESYEEWQTSKGGRLQVARIDYCLDFYAADGSCLTVGPVTGQAADTDDKAPMQALSQASKYALLQAFCIPTQDVSDPDSRSPVSESEGRTEPASKASGQASEKQIGAVKSLLRKLPPDRRAKAEQWIGDPENLSKQKASKAIEHMKQIVDEAAAEASEAAEQQSMHPDGEAAEEQPW